MTSKHVSFASLAFLVVASLFTLSACGGLAQESGGGPGDASKDATSDRSHDGKVVDHAIEEVTSDVAPDVALDLAVDVSIPCGPTTPNTCVDGCCTVAGECVLHASQSANQCGIGGASCAACKSGQKCDTNTGQCACDETSCHDGCCNVDGKCVPFSSQSPKQCGTGGLACGTCDPDDRCTAGTCTCGGYSCDGCCEADDSCFVFDGGTRAYWLCGAEGANCIECAPGQECDHRGQCACSAKSCPGGCCAANGTCEPYASQSNRSCGTGGAACAVCDNGSACGASGVCTCIGPSCTD